jgi:SPOR domain
MAAHTDQPPRSRRFIKAYLATWGLLAIAALAYLGMFAIQPHNAASPRPQTAEPEPSQAIRALARVSMDLATTRRNLSEVQKDVTDLKSVTAEREGKEKDITTRLTVVEERLSTMHAAAETAEPATTKAKTSGKDQRKRPDHLSARMIGGSSEPAQPAPGPSIKHDGPPVPLIETGSLPSKESKEEITFGAPVVTRAGPVTFAVQLAAGPNLDGLRQSWGQLRERHDALATLEPRVIAPRSEGGPYRLLAGPFSTKADADRVCSELNVGRKGCYVTPFAGAPL